MIFESAIYLMACPISEEVSIIRSQVKYHKVNFKTIVVIVWVLTQVISLILYAMILKYHITLFEQQTLVSFDGVNT